MDHLCELPNDAARRKALNTLPPTLHATYERILLRVNKRSKEVQQLVQRSLRWLVCSRVPLSSSALCEAISINTGDTTLDWTTVSGEDEVLRWCSSLVRRSASGKSLELAHFTVKEFLTTGIESLDSEYGVYHFGPENDDGELAETCLTCLSFEDFTHSGKTSKEFLHQNLAFRLYAVRYWAEHARKNLTQPEVWSLTQHLLHPSKPLVFIFWIQDLLSVFRDVYDTVERIDYLPLRDSTDLATASPLHFAAMLALPEACEWLLQEGCFVDQSSRFGTPLECALVGLSTLDEDDLELFEIPTPSAELRVSRQSTVKLIIDRGADIQKSCRHASPMYISLCMSDKTSCAELLLNGATIDDKSNELLFDYDDDIAHEILESIEGGNIRPKDHARLLDASLRFGKFPTAGSLESLACKWEDPMAAHTAYLNSFLAAAEYGQLSVLKQLLHNHKLDVNVVGGQDGQEQKSALHLAASNDHIEIVRFLLEHMADCTLTDSQGRTPLHASVKNPGRYLCLQLILGQNVDVASIDKKGLTASHLAASQGNVHALSILKSFTLDKQLCPRLKANDGRTLLHHAAQSGSKETLSFLLDHSDKDAIHDKSLDGLTALHYAVKAYSLNPLRSFDWGLDALEVLLKHGADPTSQDLMGSTAITYLVDTWEKQFLRQEKDDDDMQEATRSAAMITKILESTKDEDFLRKVCSDPHLLCLALVFGTEELAYIILKYYPSVDATAYRISHLSSLQAACFYGGCSRHLLEELFRRSKADRGDLGVTSGLLLCACEGKELTMEKTVVNLLDLGSNPNDRSTEGKTAIMLAAKRGYTAVVEILIHRGADVSATDNNGWSVIHFACQSESEELLSSLKRVSTDWNGKIIAKMHSRWSHNATALHLAASLKGCTLKFLLDNHLIGDINSITHSKETALWIAALLGISRNVFLLLDKNADDAIGAHEGEPPLHAAIRYGDMEVVMLFIDRGCNLLLQNGSGFTSELVARKFGHPEIADVLTEATSSGGKDEPARLDARFPCLTNT